MSLGLWEFFWNQVQQWDTPPPIGGGGKTYTFVYTSRTLKVFNRRKRSYPFATAVATPELVAPKKRQKPIKRARFWLSRLRRKLLPAVEAPSFLSWKRFPRPKIKRVRRWRVLRKILPPVAAPSFLSWVRPRRLKLHSRPRFVRRRLLYPIVAVVAAPALIWKRTIRFKMHSRPLARFFRPKHLIGFAPAQPSSLVWKRPLRLRIKRSISTLTWLSGGGETTPQAPVGDPTVITWRRRRQPRLRSRPWSWFFRARTQPYPIPEEQQGSVGPASRHFRSRGLRFQRPHRVYPIVGQAAPPAPLVARSLRRLRLHSRPSFRFFRPEHIIFTPATPASVIPSKKFPRPKIKRGKWLVGLRAKLRYVFAPPPASAFPWKKPLRPRIERGRWGNWIMHTKRQAFPYDFGPGPAAPNVTDFRLRAVRRGRR